MEAGGTRWTASEGQWAIVSTQLEPADLGQVIRDPRVRPTGVTRSLARPRYFYVRLSSRELHLEVSLGNQKVSHGSAPLVLLPKNLKREPRHRTTYCRLVDLCVACISQSGAAYMVHITNDHTVQLPSLHLLDAPFNTKAVSRRPISSSTLSASPVLITSGPSKSHGKGKPVLGRHGSTSCTAHDRPRDHRRVITTSNGIHSVPGPPPW